MVHHAISDAGIDDLRSALKCGTLPALIISKTNIYNIGILVAELEHVRNIRGLECDWVTDDTLPTLCGIIKSMGNLQQLKCSGIDSISFTSSQLLSDTLRTCKFLCSVSLHGNYGTPIHSIVMEAVKCCNLRSLDMTYYYMDSDGVTSLFCDPTSWVNLHTLNLSHNNIGSDGEQVLSKLLVHCENLRYLDLSSNGLYRNGLSGSECLSLAEGLKNHTSLLELKITSDGITAMIPVIKRNHLQHLDLSKCGIGSDGIAALVDVMCAERLQTLKLISNSLCLVCAMILSDGLQRCRQLMELDISYNSIGPCGMACLAEGLKCCRQLD